MGESRYLVAGGTDDQPMGRFLAAGVAGRIHHILEQQASATEQMGIEERLKPHDMKYYKETIQPLYRRLLQEIHGKAD
jgi:hypothetical protein